MILEMEFRTSLETLTLFFKMACTQNLDLRCVLISDPSTLCAGAKPRPHVPKAVAYDEKSQIMNHT